MIEVLKTDVENSISAVEILEHIHATFPTYHVNFDLKDCDRILRIKNSAGAVDVGRVMQMLTDLGFRAEPLE